MYEENTLQYEVEEERVSWGQVPPDWRDEFTSEERRTHFPYADRRWAVRRIYVDERGRQWGETVDCFGRLAPAKERCAELNAAFRKRAGQAA